MKKLALTLFVSLCMLSAHMEAMEKDWDRPTPEFLRKHLYLHPSMKPEDVGPLLVTPHSSNIKQAALWEVTSLTLTEHDKKLMNYRRQPQYPYFILDADIEGSLRYKLSYNKQPTENSPDPSCIELKRVYGGYRKGFPTEKQVKTALLPFTFFPSEDDFDYYIPGCYESGQRNSTFLWEIKSIKWQNTTGKVPEMITDVKFHKIENDDLYYNVFFDHIDFLNNNDKNASCVVLQRGIDGERRLKRARDRATRISRERSRL